MIDFLPTFNYLDPVSGGFLMQALAALGVTLAIYFRSLKNFLYSFYKKYFKRK